MGPETAEWKGDQLKLVNTDLRLNAMGHPQSYKKISVEENGQFDLYALTRCASVCMCESVCMHLESMCMHLRVCACNQFVMCIGMA